MTALRSYVIEVDDEQVGVVVEEGQTQEVTFHAVHPRAFVLHGQSFHDMRAASRAAQIAMRADKDAAND